MLDAWPFLGCLMDTLDISWLSLMWVLVLIKQYMSLSVSVVVTVLDTRPSAVWAAALSVPAWDNTKRHKRQVSMYHHLKTFKISQKTYVHGLVEGKTVQGKQLLLLKNGKSIGVIPWLSCRSFPSTKKQPVQRAHPAFVPVDPSAEETSLVSSGGRGSALRCSLQLTNDYRNWRITT